MQKYWKEIKLVWSKSNTSTRFTMLAGLLILAALPITIVAAQTYTQLGSDAASRYVNLWGYRNETSNRQYYDASTKMGGGGSSIRIKGQSCMPQSHGGPGCGQGVCLPDNNSGTGFTCQTSKTGAKCPNPSDVSSCGWGYTCSASGYCEPRCTDSVGRYIDCQGSQKPGGAINCSAYGFTQSMCHTGAQQPGDTDSCNMNGVFEFCNVNKLQTLCSDCASQSHSPQCSYYCANKSGNPTPTQIVQKPHLVDCTTFSNQYHLGPGSNFYPCSSGAVCQDGGASGQTYCVSYAPGSGPQNISPTSAYDNGGGDTSGGCPSGHPGHYYINTGTHQCTYISSCGYDQCTP